MVRIKIPKLLYLPRYNLKVASSTPVTSSVRFLHVWTHPYFNS